MLLFKYGNRKVILMETQCEKLSFMENKNSSTIISYRKLSVDKLKIFSLYFLYISFN